MEREKMEENGTQKNKGGRPKKSANESKTCPVTVYLLPEQNEYLETKRKVWGWSKSQYMAMLLEHDTGNFSEAVKRKIQPTLNTEEDRQLARELTAISTNLNQCARRLNELARDMSNLSDQNIALLERYAKQSTQHVEQLTPLLTQLRDLLLVKA